MAAVKCGHTGRHSQQCMCARMHVRVRLCTHMDDTVSYQRNVSWRFPDCPSPYLEHPFGRCSHWQTIHAPALHVNACADPRHHVIISP